MISGIRSAQRAVSTVVITVVASVATAAVAGAVPTRVPNANPAPAWEIGDCLATGDIEARSVDLASTVACSEEHVAQIVGGATVPDALRSLSRSELFATSGSDRAKLDAFVDKTCAPTAVLRNLYPKKTAKAIAKLLDRNDITLVDEWVIPAAGRFEIVLPDEASYNAGAHAVLCVFDPDPSFSGSSAGDVRDVATGDPLDTLRICFNRTGSTGTDLATCGEDHDSEGLLWLELPVADLPDAVADWPDYAWDDFDQICRDVGDLVVGASRDDLAYRADTDGELPPVGGKRFIYCEATPAADGARLPAGVSVAGLGRQELTFATA
jgi:hypothetical protein